MNSVTRNGSTFRALATTNRTITVDGSGIWPTTSICGINFWTIGIARWTWSKKNTVGWAPDRWVFFIFLCDWKFFFLFRQSIGWIDKKLIFYNFLPPGLYQLEARQRQSYRLRSRRRRVRLQFSSDAKFHRLQNRRRSSRQVTMYINEGDRGGSEDPLIWQRG